MNTDIINPGALPDVHDASKNIVWESIGAAYQPYDWDSNYDVEREVGSIVFASKSFRAPRKYQDNSGSCGGQATSFQHALLEAIATSTFEEESAKYVISQTYILDENGVMLGSRMRDNLALSCNQGISRESLCPSYPEEGDVTDTFMNRILDISAAARIDAEKRKAKTYGYVSDPSNIDVVAQFVVVNKGAQMLIRGQNNGTWFSERPKVTVEGNGFIWGHFMVLLAMEIIDGVKGIWARQSWRGAPERQWFSEEWFKSGYITQVGSILYPKLKLPSTYQFTRDLTVGSTGLDVKILQKYLNERSYFVAMQGEGSPGKETNYFGPLTQRALAKFQAAKGITPSVGFFGPKTRSFINNS